MSQKNILLGVNIDHVATLRQARGTRYPDLVPESREELTTEGGLDVVSHASAVRDACTRLSEVGVKASLFIDADKKQIDAAREVGAPVIEIHTGHYADAQTREQREQLFAQIKDSVAYAHEIGLQVNAGHGLNLQNIKAIAGLDILCELNIGHAIIADAVFMGLEQSVKTYKQAMYEARA